MDEKSLPRENNFVMDWIICLKVVMHPLSQGFSTPGPRTGTGPWLNQYRAAQE